MLLLEYQNISYTKWTKHGQLWDFKIDKMLIQPNFSIVKREHIFEFKKGIAGKMNSKKENKKNEKSCELV